MLQRVREHPWSVGHTILERHVHMDSKVCAHCGGEPQALEDFPLRRGSPDGRDKACKACHREWTRKQRERTREERERQKAERRAERARKRDERTEDRFWTKIDRGGPDDCWMWKASITPTGYGQFTVRHGCPRPAHRVAYELLVGPIPDGLCLLHRCDVRWSPGDMTYRKCVNPAHMFLGTRQENSADMVAKGRDCHGERHPHHKLTDDDVRRMVEQWRTGTMSQHALAEAYHVAQSTVSRLVRGVKRRYLGIKPREVVSLGGETRHG